MMMSILLTYSVYTEVFFWGGYHIIKDTVPWICYQVFIYQPVFTMFFIFTGLISEIVRVRLYLLVICGTFIVKMLDFFTDYAFEYTTDYAWEWLYFEGATAAAMGGLQGVFMLGWLLWLAMSWLRSVRGDQRKGITKHQAGRGGQNQGNRGSGDSRELQDLGYSVPVPEW